MAFRDIFGKPASVIKDSFKKSQEWLNDMINTVFGKTNDNKTKTDDETEKDKLSFKGVNYPEIGKLYFFMYHDPETKDTLPYWDKFPIVIPVEYVQLKKGEGFLGLNLHYLPPSLRATLLDILILTYQDTNFSGDERRININYDLLREFVKNVPMARNCIKKYYIGRIMPSKNTKGKFNEINPNDWKFAVTLPLHEWVRNPNSRYASVPLPW